MSRSICLFCRYHHDKSCTHFLAPSLFKPFPLSICLFRCSLFEQLPERRSDVVVKLPNGGIVQYDCKKKFVNHQKILHYESRLEKMD